MLSSILGNFMIGFYHIEGAFVILVVTVDSLACTTQNENLLTIVKRIIV